MREKPKRGGEREREWDIEEVVKRDGREIDGVIDKERHRDKERVI